MMEGSLQFLCKCLQKPVFDLHRNMHASQEAEGWLQQRYLLVNRLWVPDESIGHLR